MAGNNVLGVGKNLANLPDNVGKASNSKKSDEKTDLSFMNFMNLSNTYAQSPGFTADSIKDLNVSKSQNKDTGFKEDYMSGASKSSDIEMKQEMTAEKLQSESGSELNDYADKVNEVLKEELGLTEEEIAAAMEHLGMSVMDLMDPANLTLLVQKLTGTQDVGTLLMSESFQNVVSDIGTLTEELCKELGISMEELTALCKELTNLQNETPQIAEETQSPQETQNPQEVPEDNDSNVVMGSKTGLLPTEQVSNTVQTAARTEDGSEEPVKSSIQDEQITETTEEPQQTDAKSNESFQDSKGDSLKDHTHGTTADNQTNAVSPWNSQSVAAQPFSVAEAAQAYTPQMDIADIIEQITKNAKVTFAAESTSMEMHLNPENLGKIYLHVTEKEGAVRAEIAAQSETVKNALEAQIVELRQNLNQQGIRVDAIEVTVASHAFEQNLDGNARQEEQLQQQLAESGKKGRRNLNLSDLDQLSGLMTEEETLVAKIMQENGNQVDLNA